MVITDIVMVRRLKQSHDMTQTAPQIAFYSNCRHKAIQDARFQVIRSLIFEILRYRFSPLARAMSHRVPILTPKKSNLIKIYHFSRSEMDFRISANFNKMKNFIPLIFRGLSFEK